ncbi:MAG: hypothetical protein J6D34_08530 [Atopobiaceae bacterium]|nr:hypothetical protein [Atopobiaceae bacterium]
MGRRPSIPWEECSEFLLVCGSEHEPYRFSVRVVERIRDLVPYDQAICLMLDGNRKIVRKHFVGVPERWSQMYLNYYSKSVTDDFSLTSDAFEIAGRGYVDLIDWRDIDWIHDDFMDNYIKPRNLSESLSFVLFDLKGSPATIFCLDRLNDGRFSDCEVEVVRLLTAHLSNLYKNLFVRPTGQVRMWDGAVGAGDLTPREREVLDLLCQGIKPVYIARELHISLGTANKHIAHIYRKLGVDNKQELLVKLLGK